MIVERSKSEYAHSGRGGAGNYTETTTLAEATAQATDVTPALEETKPPQTGYYGRGGAGNYRIGNSESRENDMKAMEAQDRLHQQVVKDVETGLKEPEKAHLGRQRLRSDSSR